MSDIRRASELIDEAMASLHMARSLMTREPPVDHKLEERDRWRDLGPARQAGIRCKEPTFWAFLREGYYANAHSEEDAAQAVRSICSVLSRADLDKPGRSQARIKWHDLDYAFQAWKVAEHA